MSSSASLLKIRDTWINRVAHRLARGEEVRESFIEQLGWFYEMLQRAVETGDPAWLNPVLDGWVQARTETELSLRESSLPPFLDHILLLTFEVANEMLEPAAALRLIGAVLPVYTYAFEYTTQRETQLHIDHIAHDLDIAKLSLERLDKSKSNFISIAAHELKTPLTLIEGYASMMREHMQDLDGREMTKVLLKGINNGTRRLREIIDDMIDVSMIDNDLLSLNFQPVWLNRLLFVIQNEFTEILSERHIQLKICSFPGSEEMTFGDPERLYQAFRNVISNAIKYTPDGGQVIVDGRTLPGFFEVTVTDTGIGIDPEDHTRIFMKFGKLGDAATHSSGKTKFKGGGPGLGLPITKGIVEAHGGAIWVESDGYDEARCPGTIFHILLPQRRQPPDERTARLFQPLVESSDALE